MGTAALARRPLKEPVAQPTPVSGSGALQASSVPLRYLVKRLGANVERGQVEFLEPTLQVLDAGIVVCLHSRQPGVDISSNADFAFRIRMGVQYHMHAPVEVLGKAEDRISEYLMGCVQRLVNETGVRDGPQVRVRYGLVAEKAEDGPGRYIQRIDVALAEEQVEAGVPLSERRVFSESLRNALLACLQRHPVEIRGRPNRWMALSPAELVGSVDASRPQTLQLQNLTPRDHSELNEQLRCAAAAMPTDARGTEARGRWVYEVRISLMGDALPVPPSE
jgi:hypothetical protein